MLTSTLFLVLIICSLHWWGKTLDSAHASYQLVLEESRKFVATNTHCGLYQYTFGIASLPARTLDTILQGLDSVIFYIDDILITHRNIYEIWRKFFKSCRHKVDAKGLHTNRKQVASYS